MVKQKAVQLNDISKDKNNDNECNKEHELDGFLRWWGFGDLTGTKHSKCVMLEKNARNNGGENVAPKNRY